jgi:hypothetical protein
MHNDVVRGALSAGHDAHVLILIPPLAVPPSIAVERARQKSGITVDS